MDSPSQQQSPVASSGVSANMLSGQRQYTCLGTFIGANFIHRVESLHLSTLRSENQETINLHPVWEDHPKELEENRCLGIYFVHTKEFDAVDILKGLEFRPKPVSWCQGSPGTYNWLQSVKMEHGSPWESKRVFDSGQTAL